MAFSDFTLQTAMRAFGLSVDTSQDLFAQVPPVPVGAATATLLRENAPLALSVGTEKARSEMLIAPLLAEVWRRSGHTVGVFSGVALDVDAEAGLTGVCDFVLASGPLLPQLSSPLLVVVEAKREDIAGGFGQCTAGMVAADRMNRRSSTWPAYLYGCVTSGSNWKFLRLDGTRLAIDLPEYFIDQPDRILGILVQMVAGPARP